MNNLIISFFYILILFIFIILVSLYLYYLDISYLYEWLIFNFNSLNIEFILLIDWISLVYVRIVLIISSMVIFYRKVYIINEKFIERFNYLVIIFILSIILIILSPNLIRILFGWDGLGLTSYCLVIYYQNFISYNSGIITVLCNRIGDIRLLIVIRLVIIYGRWRGYFLREDKIIVGLLILAAITKSAQVPFSYWLPIAIAAPTPVSALVHSSTLVTAGIYLMIRFNKILILSGISICLIFLSVLTIFISGLIANFEYDFKKIIALSTLRQLGLIIIILSLGLKLISFYHLLVHAIFKSLLFLCVGIIIHIIFNNQDIRYYGNLNEYLPFVISRFYISRISLCGYPFLAGFYSKDLIIEIINFNEINLIILFLILISLVFTVSYTIRLILYIFYGRINYMSRYFIRENKIINVSINLLIVLRIFRGRILIWIFFYDFKFIYLRLRIKLIIIILSLMGIFLSLLLYIKNFIYIYYLIYFFRSIWFINNMYMFLRKLILNYRLRLEIVDKLWLEFSKKLMYLNILKNFLRIEVKELRIFIFLYLFILFIIYLYIY